MIFQTLDSKAECYGYFANNELIFDNPPSGLTGTWKYTPSAAAYAGSLDYAYVAYGGKSLRDLCPEHMTEEWDAAEGKMKAFFRSFTSAKVSLNEHCFFDMVPEQFLFQYYGTRNRITEHALKGVEKAENYEFLVQVHEMLETIASQKLNIDREALKSNFHQMKTRNFFKKLPTIKPYARYNMFGSKTGRLTNIKGNFPVLTLDRDHRNVLLPNNDLFVELDYNGAEIRTLLALSGKEQPKEDIHSWNVQNVARGFTTRDKMKERFFAWMYNPSASDHMIEKFYDKEAANDFWDGAHVTTPYGRKIEADSHHSLNYLIQSTTSDLVLENALKIFDYVSGHKTKIAFTVHDSIVLDLAAEDRDHIIPILKIFEETRFGTFKANMSVGKKYGDLKGVAWKQ